MVKVEFEVSISKNPGLPKKIRSPKLPKWQNFLEVVFLPNGVITVTDLDPLLQQHQDNSMLVVTYKKNKKYIIKLLKIHFIQINPYEMFGLGREERED